MSLVLASSRRLYVVLLFCEPASGVEAAAAPASACGPDPRLASAVSGCRLVRAVRLQRHWAPVGDQAEPLYFDKMGLTYQSVAEYYRGAEGRFLQPRSYRGLLEVAHFHVFAMGIFVLTLTHLVLFVPFSPRAKLWLIGLSFGSALADEAAGWLIRFVHPAFAYAKIAAFLLLQGSLAVLIVAVSVAILTGSRNAYSEHVKP